MAVDYFLKIDGIDGESKQTGHAKELEMDSWSFGETQSGTAATSHGSAQGKVTLNEFRFSKPLDISSPKILVQHLSGKHVKWARFTARRAGSEGGVPTDYLFVDFGDLVISQYEISGFGSDGWPYENIAFSYGALKMSYKQMIKGVAQGAVSGGYDAEKNTKNVSIPGPPAIK